MTINLERLAGEMTFRIFDVRSGNFVEKRVAPVINDDGQITFTDDTAIIAQYEKKCVVGRTPTGIAYPGCNGADGISRDIFLADKLYRSGKSMTHFEVMQAAQTAVPGALRPLNFRDAYQTMRKNFAERASGKRFLDEYVASLRHSFYNRLPRFAVETDFRGVDEMSTIRQINLDGKATEHLLPIPEGPHANGSWKYIILAPEQPMARLGTPAIVSAEFIPVLEAYFGEGAEEAGPVLQYHSTPLANGNMREIRLWIPDKYNRDFTGSLVADSKDDRFGLDTDGNDNRRPALAGVQRIRESYTR